MGNPQGLIVRRRVDGMRFLRAYLFLWPILVLHAAFALSPPEASNAAATAAVSVPAHSRIALTPAEIAYIRVATPVRVAVTGSGPPLYQINERGELDGVVGDYLRWVSETTGLAFEVKSLPTFEDSLNAAAAGQVDLLPLFALDKSRLPGFTLTRTYLSIPTVYIARRGLTDVSPANNFNGYKVAVVRATSADEYLQRSMPGAKRVPYSDGAQAIKAVSTGEADVFVGPLALASYYIDKNLLFNLDLRGEVNASLGAYSMAITAKPPELASIIRKALNAMTQAEDIGIRSKWTSSQSLLKPLDMQAALTPDEIEWVKQNRELRVAYDREFVPFSFEEQGGAMSGLAADYLKLVEQKVGLKVIATKAESWDAALADVRSGRANLLIAAARNDERRSYLTFVGPYAGVPTGIVARLNDKLVMAMDDLAHEQVAAIQSHFLLPTLKRQYPGMKIVEFESQRAALDAVESGKVRAAIGNLNVIDPILQRHFLGALRVVNTVPRGDSELYFAVPSGVSELARVLRKGLDGVTPQEHAALRQKWLNVTYQSGVPWRKILQIGLPIAISLLIVLVVTLWWNRKLKQEVALRSLAESRLTEALTAAQNASEAKSRFLATMSHEIRNPVSGIVGTAHALMRHAETPRQRESLQVIRDSGDYLIRLLTQVLDHTKSEAGKFTLVAEWINLKKLIEESVNPFRYVAEQKNLKITSNVEGSLAASHQVDPMRLRQVITNLISNAIKFTERGGIKITLFADDLIESKQAVRIRVQDTGPGIPEAARETLFKPYSQTDLGRHRPDSTGLGLSICKEAIERLDGSVRLLNNEELPNTISLNLPGACFEITLELPARGSMSEGDSNSNSDSYGGTVSASDNSALVADVVAGVRTVEIDGAEHAASDGAALIFKPPLIGKKPTGPRVLLADDDALNLALHREVLEGAGFIVDTAANGHIAFTLWLREGHEIIFSDGSMPVMSGLELVKAVRAAGISSAARPKKVSKPWFVLLTSYSSALDQDDFIKAGVDDFIEKPLLPRGLQEAMVRRSDAIAVAAKSGTNS